MTVNFDYISFDNPIYAALCCLAMLAPFAVMFIGMAISRRFSAKKETIYYDTPSYLFRDE